MGYGKGHWDWVGREYWFITNLDQNQNNIILLSLSTGYISLNFYVWSLIVKVHFSMSKICSIVDDHEFNIGGFGCFNILITCFMAVTHNILKRWMLANFIIPNKSILTLYYLVLHIYGII